MFPPSDLRAPGLASDEQMVSWRFDGILCPWSAKYVPVAPARPEKSWQYLLPLFLSPGPDRPFSLCRWLKMVYRRPLSFSAPEITRYPYRAQSLAPKTFLLIAAWCSPSVRSW